VETEAALRSKILATATRMSETGLSPGRSGNISARYKDGFLLTPSAVPYDQMTEADIVFLGDDGETRSGTRRPSTEWLFHAMIYRNFETARAVLHCHSLYATTLACLGRSIPAFHYMVAVAGGNDIPCAGYATFGSHELAQLAIDVLANRRACLLGNHGQLAYADSLDSVYALSCEVENLANVYWNTLQIGEPALLGDEEMRQVVEKFRDYRQPGS
jgi:L-fuculose-phosphate aldolase